MSTGSTRGKPNSVPRQAEDVFDAVVLVDGVAAGELDAYAAEVQAPRCSTDRPRCTRLALTISLISWMAEDAARRSSTARHGCPGSRQSDRGRCVLRKIGARSCSP